MVYLLHRYYADHCLSSRMFLEHKTCWNSLHFCHQMQVGGKGPSVGPARKRSRLTSSNRPNCIQSFPPVIMEVESVLKILFILNMSKAIDSIQHIICITKQSCHNESSNERNFSWISSSNLFCLAAHVFRNTWLSIGHILTTLSMVLHF
jgi:hypothetical protein